MRALRSTPVRGLVPALVVALAGVVAGCSSTGPAVAELSGTVSEGSAPSVEGSAPQTADEARAETTEQPPVTTGPDESSAVRSVVDDFPLDLLPLPDDAVVLVTSAAQVGDAEVQEVSLNLRTQLTADKVLTLYRATLLEAGFVEVVPETVHTDLAVETLFTRSAGDELVSIGVLDDGAGRTVTIGGRIRTAG